MGRGLAFSVLEDDFVISNCENKTAKELYELHCSIRHEMLWPERTLKSIARRVERLRDADRVDTRTSETRRKAYYERSKRIRGD